MAMDPTFDTVCLHEIVSQHQDTLRRRAAAHARLPRTRRSRLQSAERGRARRWLAEALHHLAERIEPTRLEPRSATR
jgi:hypothetical protein